MYLAPTMLYHLGRKFFSEALVIRLDNPGKMDFDLHLFFQAIPLGIVAAAPIGPVNMEVIRRGLAGGFRPAFAAGLGSSTMDTLCCLIVYISAERLIPLVSRPGAQSGMLILGAVFLTAFGLYLIRKAIRAGAIMLERNSTTTNIPASAPASLAKCFAVGFVLTGLNLFTLAYWITTYLVFMKDKGRLGFAVLVPVAGVMLGTLGWMLFISTLARFGRRWIRPRFFRIVNLLCGLALLGFAGYFLYVLLAGKPIIPSPKDYTTICVDYRRRFRLPCAAVRITQLRQRRVNS